MILSGSWRRIERRPRAKVRPFLLVDRNLQHAGQLVFDRVFDGDDLVAAGVDLGERAYSVVVLPLPVGPVTSSMP
jgi:hypothetical protein